MPAHALVAIGVEIEEAGVEGGVGGGFDFFFDGAKLWGPEFGGMGVAGVAIVEVAVAIPGHLASGDDALAEHDGFVVLPGDGFEEEGEEFVGLLGREEGAVVVDDAVLGEEVFGGSWGVEVKLVLHGGGVCWIMTERWGGLKSHVP